MESGVPSDFSTALESLITSLATYYSGTTSAGSSSSGLDSSFHVLPPPSTLAKTRTTLHTTLPLTGHGLTSTTDHLLSLLPSFPSSSNSSAYYGFVTGGTTPAALVADYIASTIDQNIQVHLPGESLATEIERHALTMLLQLFQLPEDIFRGKCLTTGATGGNMLALAAAREALVDARIQQRRVSGELDSAGENSVGELGLLEACQLAGIKKIQILTAAAHSSVPKAASVIGVGRSSIIDIAHPQRPWEVDLAVLEERLKEAKKEGWVSVVALGMGEVNTGRFPAEGEMRSVMRLAESFGGVQGGVWVHVDAAMGIFVRALLENEGEHVDEWEKEAGRWADGLDLVDSITGDGHKLLNVPYDCGFFFTRHPSYLQRTFVNIAPYLSSGPTNPGDIPSPLNMQLENSRRFRALPVYATLTAYGAAGYRNLVRRLILHAREIARYIENSADYELLPTPNVEYESHEVALEAKIGKIFMVVLFRAKGDGLNEVLKERINASGRMYVSGTMWEGRKAVRCAVANWRVSIEKGGERGWGVVPEVLETIAKEYRP